MVYFGFLWFQIIEWTKQDRTCSKNTLKIKIEKWSSSCFPPALIKGKRRAYDIALPPFSFCKLPTFFQEINFSSKTASDDPCFETINLHDSLEPLHRHKWTSWLNIEN